MDLIKRIRNARTKLRCQDVKPLDEQGRYLCVLSVDDLQWLAARCAVPIGADGEDLVSGHLACKAMHGPKELEGYVLGKQHGKDGLDMIVGIKLLEGE